MGEQEITGLDFHWQKLKAGILFLLHCSTKLSFLGKGEKCSLWLASIFWNCISYSSDSLIRMLTLSPNSDLLESFI